MEMQDFWQAPGNKKIFSNRLFVEPNGLNKNKSNSYTFWSLKYFYDNIDKILIHSQKNTDKLKKFVFENIKINENKTSPIHLITSLVFYGFLKIYKDIINGEKVKIISLTTYGRIFFEKWNYLIFYSNDKEKDDKELVEIFIRNSLFKLANFRNGAFKKPFSFNLKPFPILFYLIIKKNNRMTFEFILNKLIFIKDVNELKSAIKEEHYNHINIKESHAYGKFKTWVISSFVDIGLFDEKKNQISISSKYLKFITNLILEFNDKNDDETFDLSWIFFDTEDQYQTIIDLISSKKKKARNYEIVKKILENVDSCKFQDFNINKIGELNINHDTFIKNSNNQKYYEAHHMIPFSSHLLDEEIKNNSKNIDSIENLIPVCSTCHRFLTSGLDDDKIAFLNTMLKILHNNGWNFITLKSLKMIYSKSENAEY